MIVLEPRGLIRLLQFIFAIFAFATACTGSSSVSIRYKGPPEGNINTSWSYPYNLKDAKIQTPNDTGRTVSDSNDIKSSAEFFVFTGVTSMLLTLVFLIIYIFLDQRYRNDSRIPLVDFTITIIWTIFWLAGSSAWAQGVSNIRSQTSWGNVAQRSNFCSTDNQLCNENYSKSLQRPRCVMSIDRFQAVAMPTWLFRLSSVFSISYCGSPVSGSSSRKRISSRVVQPNKKWISPTSVRHRPKSHHLCVNQVA